MFEDKRLEHIKFVQHMILAWKCVERYISNVEYYGHQQVYFDSIKSELEKAVTDEQLDLLIAPLT